jgi:hypothetical protein
VPKLQNTTNLAVQPVGSSSVSYAFLFLVTKVIGISNLSRRTVPPNQLQKSAIIDRWSQASIRVWSARVRCRSPKLEARSLFQVDLFYEYLSVLFYGSPLFWALSARSGSVLSAGCLVASVLSGNIPGWAFSCWPSWFLVVVIALERFELTLAGRIDFCL